MGSVNAAELRVILNGDQTLLNRTLQQSQRSMMGWVRQVMGLRPALNVNTAAADRSVAAFAARTKSALSGGFSVAGGALATFGGNLMTSAFSTITGGFSDLVARGVAFNDVIEAANISFRKFLGNQEAANQMIGDLKKFAASTPFDFKGIVQTSSVMAALGYEAKEIIPILTAVGDAVSAAGKGKEELDSVIDALTKIRNSGKIEADQMNRLMDNRIRAWKYLSDASGISEEKLRKLAEQGQLNSREAVKIILAGMKKDSSGMMDEMSRTRVGMESNRNDALDQAAGQAVTGGYIEEVKRGYQQQVEFIQGEGGALMVRASGEAGKAAGIAWNEGQLKAMKMFNIFAQDAKEGGYAAAAGNAIINNTPQPVIDAANKVISSMDGVNNAVSKILGWKIPGFRGGGKASGPGTSTSDSIPAMLSTDEYVINAADAKRVGYNFLDHINSGGKIFGFRRGGRVRSNPEALRARAEQLLADPRVRAFLDAIAYGEGDYNEIVGGSRFSDFSRHPNKYVAKFDSTAAGRYQFLIKTWRETAGKMGLPDFSPHSQDLAAVQLMIQRGMLGPLFRGDLDTAVRRGAPEWASLTAYGNSTGYYRGQRAVPIDKTISEYQKSLQKGPVAGTNGQGESPNRPLFVSVVGPETLTSGHNSNPRQNPFFSGNPRTLRSGHDPNSRQNPFFSGSSRNENDDLYDMLPGAWRSIDSETIPVIEPGKFDPAINKFTAAGIDLAEQTIPELDAAVFKLATSADLIYQKFLKPEASPTGATAPKPSENTPQSQKETSDRLLKPAEGVNWQEVMKEESRNAIRQLLTGNFRGAAASFIQGIGNKMLDGLSEQLTGKWMDAIGNKLAGWISNIMGKLLGGLFGGARAEGGPVQAGKMYRIRERGMDEYFVPNTDGTVYNQQQMNAMTARGKGAATGGGGTTVYNFNLPANDRDPLSRRSMRQAAREFKFQQEYATK